MENNIGEYVDSVVLSRFNFTHNLSIKRKIVIDILGKVHAKPEVNINLAKLKAYHPLTYNHCMNTAVLAIFIGYSLRLGQEDLIGLATAGLLHDIGKEKVTKDILDKRGLLTKEEFGVIILHPVEGYVLIKDCENIPLKVKIAVLEHHERIDGSGYPFKLKGEDISLYGKILAIVDSYDALVSDRPYHKIYSPEEAFDILSKSVEKYDKTLLKIFEEYLTRNRRNVNIS